MNSVVLHRTHVQKMSVNIIIGGFDTLTSKVHLPDTGTGSKEAVVVNHLSSTRLPSNFRQITYTIAIIIS